MHAGQLGRHADHVDGALVLVPRSGSSRRDPPCVGPLTPRRTTGAATPPRSPAAATAAASAPSTACDGTSTPTVTSRSPLPALARRALALDPEGLPARRAGRDLQRHRPVQRGHLHLRAERGLRVGDRQLERQVGALAPEEGVLRRPSPCTNRSPGGPPAVPGSPLPATLIRAPSRHARRDLHLDRARPPLGARPVARRTRRLDQAAAPAAVRTGLGHLEEALVHHALPDAPAVRAGDRLRPRRRARPRCRPSKRRGR